jgi:hypothetical protein
MPRQVLLAYGLRIACPLPVPGSAPSGEAVDVEVVLHPAAADVEARWSGAGAEPRVEYRHVDGRTLEYHRGDGGDTLLRWDGAGTWVLDPGRTRVDAHSPADPPDPAWQRVLLDSVLGSVALGRGAEALHAGAVLTERGALAVLGASGTGKTSLLTALLERGHALVADDVLVLAGPGEAHPGPPVLNVPGDADVGTPLARLGDETWVHAHAVAQGPVPLRALVLLDRAADGPEPAELVAEQQPFAPLYANLLPSRASDAERFAVVAELAARVPVLRLRAAATVTPGELAGLVEGA